MMKHFDEKFRACAGQALAREHSDTGMPFRFSDQVLSRLARPEFLECNADRVWLRLGLRTLAGVSLVLLLVSLYRVPSQPGRYLLPPPIEHSIVNASGLL